MFFLLKPSLSYGNIHNSAPGYIKKTPAIQHQKSTMSYIIGMVVMENNQISMNHPTPHKLSIYMSSIEMIDKPCIEISQLLYYDIPEISKTLEKVSVSAIFT